MMVFILALLILSLDQLTKFLIVKNLYLHQSLPLVRNIFHLTLVHNRGAAFGLFKGQVFLFILTSAAAVILIVRDLIKHKRFSIYSLSLALILAGAIGNLIDRLFLGYVIDFLDFRVWPVFNIADSAITAGAVLLGWGIINRGQGTERNNKKDFSVICFL